VVKEIPFRGINQPDVNKKGAWCVEKLARRVYFVAVNFATYLISLYCALNYTSKADETFFNNL
jgi:hypothetical protein